MSTLTISIPDALSTKLAALSGAERRRVAELAGGEFADDIHENILEALAEAELANRFTPDEEHADLLAAISEADADIAAGRTTSLEQELSRWETLKEELAGRGRK